VHDYPYNRAVVRCERLCAIVALLLIPVATRAMSPSPEALFGKYCVSCHNDKLRTGGLSLEKLDGSNLAVNVGVWEKVARKLRAGEMPPKGLPRPDHTTLISFVSAIEDAVDRSAPENPGRVALHRLNRSEYGNAIRDLLDIEIDPEKLLPQDDEDQNGFENIAGVLTVSPRLMEAYISTAALVSRLAVGDLSAPAVFDTFNISKTIAQDDRMSEDLPFGSRGGIAFHFRFPVDAEYVVKIRLRKQLYDYIVGLGHPQTLEVRVDGKPVKSFIVGGEDHGMPAPATFVGAVSGAKEWEEYMHSADLGLETRFPVKAGARVVGISFVGEFSEPEGVWTTRNSTFGISSDEQLQGNAAIETVSVGGPFQPAAVGDTASRHRIFVCHPAGIVAQQECPKQIISRLGRLAYRRPLTPADLDVLLRVYRAGQERDGFEGGIRSAIQAILCDPDFLFRTEGVPKDARPGSIYRLSDLEIASRLAFFLWSSIPDGDLLSLAERGKLKDPAAIEAQTRRMFADRRSRALVSNFAAQWLGLRKIRGVTPDPVRYADFDDGLRDAFETETRLFLESQILGDHSVKDLLSADYTFVNQRLAQHYGISQVYGNHFRRVDLPSNGARGGLFGQASILTLTSYADRTSPVLRGKWLLDNVLGSPPPPPPPDVPPLSETGADGKTASVRERLESHRKNPACAVCHVKMDPLGFVLENFDAIGQWRSKSEGIAIDASAMLPDGTQMDGPAGLRRALLGHSDEFVRTVTEKLLTYALGRELQVYDAPVVRKIVREAAASDYRWSAIILGIAKSAPFEMSSVDAERPGDGNGSH
jgi:hypothetical protein